MPKRLTVRVVNVGNLQYASLGSGDVALSLTAVLEATNGGHHIVQDGEILYYNGGAEGEYAQDLYQHVVDRAMQDER
jgi:hypothetical protein